MTSGGRSRRARGERRREKELCDGEKGEKREEEVFGLKEKRRTTRQGYGRLQGEKEEEEEIKSAVGARGKRIS